MKDEKHTAAGACVRATHAVRTTRPITETKLEVYDGHRGLSVSRPSATERQNHTQRSELHLHSPSSEERIALSVSPLENVAFLAAEESQKPTDFQKCTAQGCTAQFQRRKHTSHSRFQCADANTHANITRSAARSSLQHFCRSSCPVPSRKDPPRPHPPLASRRPFRSFRPRPATPPHLSHVPPRAQGRSRPPAPTLTCGPWLRPPGRGDVVGVVLCLRLPPDKAKPSEANNSSSWTPPKTKPSLSSLFGVGCA